MDMLASYADNVIVGTVLKIKETNPEVVLITTDTNMKIAAESAGILCNENKLPKRSSSLVPLSSVIISLIVSAYFIVAAFIYGDNYASVRWSVGASALLSLIIITFGTVVRALCRNASNSRGYEPEYKSKEKSNPVIYSPIFSNTKGNIYHVDRDRR